MVNQLEVVSVTEVLPDIRAGKLIILVDDADRENEGDLILAASQVSSESLQFMMRYARGLICVSLSKERASRLDLPLQAANNGSRFNTPFTVSVDYKDAVTYGVTARGRALTISKLLNDQSSAADFISPGNVFPLIAHEQGVLGRQGQTEGSYDLARIAGLEPAGIVCEILNQDGTMARGESLNAFARDHKLKITSVEEIIKYRRNEEVLVRKMASSVLGTDFGEFRTIVFQDDVDGKEHLALIHGDLSSCTNPNGPLVRLHSECLTGDVFSSRRCDCGSQLERALSLIRAEECGVLLYLRQEGRGIGLLNKLKAYQLQDQGDDTVEANIKLGFGADERDFRVAARILNSLDLDRVRLITNNPRKVEALRQYGIMVNARVPVVVIPDEYSERYLETKRTKLGHIF